MAVIVNNKNNYPSLENEDKKVFLKRVKVELEKDFDEAIDIVEVSNESLEKFTEAMLTQAYKVSVGLQSEILEGILKGRGIEVEKIVKTEKAKVEKVDIEVAKASDDYKAAKANVGRLVQYTPAKSEEIVVGVIKSISLNKTNTIIYYNIKVGETLRCATSKNETLQYFDF